MRVLAVTSGRADTTPMEPVVKALMEKFEVTVHQTDGLQWPSLEGVVCHLESAISSTFDIALLLGDRYEILAAALAATVAKVPIAHIHGGEASFGSFDNQIRDAVTKLSHIHFVAAPEFKVRLVEGLGEDPRRVHVVGAPGLDNLTDLPERKPEKYFVCTYHPATLEKERAIHALLEALDRFPDYHQIWTGVNNDPGNEEIRNALAGRDVRRLNSRDYHLLCRHAAAVVGNSSSGIIEAPTLEVPTVNVRSRQDGRLKGPSIVDTDNDVDAIEAGIKWALVYDSRHPLAQGPYENPYGKPGASKKIADILSTISLDGILVKRWSA